MIIMGCPGGKINMAAVSAKRSIPGDLDAIDGIQILIKGPKNHNDQYISRKVFFGAIASYLRS